MDAIKSRFQRIVEGVPSEDLATDAERLLSICTRISTMCYGKPTSEPEHTMIRNMCRRDAAWLAKYVLDYLLRENSS